MISEGLLSNPRLPLTKSWTLCVLILMFSPSHSASITTLFSPAHHQFQLISNHSYRTLFLRQYFLDSLNRSHSSLIASHQFITHSEQIQSRRRKRRTNHPLSSMPLFTLHPTNCSALNPHQIQSTFELSHSIASLPSVELIYRLDSNERQEPAIPVRIVIRQSATSNELFSVPTHLQFDTTREFYFLNINDYLRQRTEQSLVIETIIFNQTCRSSHADLLVSSRRLTHPSAQGKTKCQVKTIEVQFEELGLAYLIIRPKQYTFSYCDGSCTDLTLHRTSLHAFLQSMISRKNPAVPHPNCVPSQYADDNFLLRQVDGNVQIYPIKDIIVKQCACL